MYYHIAMKYNYKFLPVSFVPEEARSTCYIKNQGLHLLFYLVYFSVCKENSALMCDLEERTKTLQKVVAQNKGK